MGLPGDFPVAWPAIQGRPVKNRTMKQARRFSDKRVGGSVPRRTSQFLVLLSSWYNVARHDPAALWDPRIHIVLTSRVNTLVTDKKLPIEKIVKLPWHQRQCRNTFGTWSVISFSVHAVGPVMDLGTHLSYKWCCKSNFYWWATHGLVYHTESVLHISGWTISI